MMDEIKDKCEAHGSFQWEAAELVARVSDDNSPDNIADLVEFCIRTGMQHGMKHQKDYQDALDSNNPPGGGSGVLNDISDSVEWRRPKPLPRRSRP